MNNAEQKKNKPFYQQNWFPVGLAVLFAAGLIGMAMNGKSPNSSPQTQSLPTLTLVKSSFDEISQVDQARMNEILTGVMQDTIPVTSDVKNELRGIFAKYRATDAEVNDFATYGPALMVNYQKLFFADALQAVTSGVPVKGSERLDLEKEAISRGLLTNERVVATDKEMNLIASHQPVVGSDGRQIIFTVDSINSTLSNIDSIAARIKLLLDSTPTTQTPFFSPASILIQTPPLKNLPTPISIAPVQNDTQLVRSASSLLEKYTFLNKAINLSLPLFESIYQKQQSSIVRLQQLQSITYRSDVAEVLATVQGESDKLLGIITSIKDEQKKVRQATEILEKIVNALEPMPTGEDFRKFINDETSSVDAWIYAFNPNNPDNIGSVIYTRDQKTTELQQALIMRIKNTQ